MIYHDDSIQLSRYRNLIAALCANEVKRIRDFGYVDTIDEPVLTEEPAGVRASLHDIFCDLASDALYEATYEVFVSYAGIVSLNELSVDPVPNKLLPWERGEGHV